MKTKTLTARIVVLRMKGRGFTVRPGERVLPHKHKREDRKRRTTRQWVDAST